MTFDDRIPGQDSRRIALTCLLVYAAFLCPTFENSMTWNFLDTAVSFVDTGRWRLVHGELYRWADTVPVPGGGRVSTLPPGVPVLVVPVYAAWRTVLGPAESRSDFAALHALATLVVGATASALLAVQVAALAGWLGAGRRGSLLAAILVGFGTHAFVFGTALYKENVGALCVVAAFRLAVQPGLPYDRALAGALAGVATLVVNTAAVLVPLLLVLLVVREGIRGGAAYVAGGLPLALALAVYNTWLFGVPWRVSYDLHERGPVVVDVPRFDVLLETLVHPRAGLFFHSPFLLAGVAGLILAGRRKHRGEAVVTAAFFTGTWVLVSAYQGHYVPVVSGTRYLLMTVPLLAAFAAPVLERVERRLLLALAAPSIFVCYLVVQAGHMPGTGELDYALKTWISGTGMAVMFKEVIPAWLGIETLHGLVSRSDVTASDLLRMLPTARGLALARNQALMLGLNLLVLGAVAWVVYALWRPAPRSHPVEAPIS